MLIVRNMAIAASIAALAPAACQRGDQDATSEVSYSTQAEFIELQRDKIAAIEQALTRLEREAEVGTGETDEEVKERIAELERRLDSARAALRSAATAERAEWPDARDQAMEEIRAAEEVYASLSDDLRGS